MLAAGLAEGHSGCFYGVHVVRAARPSAHGPRCTRTTTRHLEFHHQSQARASPSRAVFTPGPTSALMVTESHQPVDSLGP